MLYFMMVLAFGMIYTHPVCLAISLLCAMNYSIYLNGKKALRFIMIYMLPMMIFTALINPVFNHEGNTILNYLPDGNPLTLESIAYGIAAASMLVLTILWFSCFNTVMTSDKFVYIFGRLIPATSLILAISLRFVPRFRDQIKTISNAQKCVGRDVSNGNILQKARHGIKILSIMVTWTMENAIETADSMKARGYGLPGRTAFSIYYFERRDVLMLAFTLFVGIYIIAGVAIGGIYFRYFPSIKSNFMGVYGLSIFVAYLTFCAAPFILNLYEDRAWRLSRSKI
jgi:energy-coupling factor transport system permease protein